MSRPTHITYDTRTGGLVVVRSLQTAPGRDRMEIHYAPLPGDRRTPEVGEMLDTWVDGSTRYAVAPRAYQYGSAEADELAEEIVACIDATMNLEPVDVVGLTTQHEAEHAGMAASVAGGAMFVGLGLDAHPERHLSRAVHHVGLRGESQHVLCLGELGLRRQLDGRAVVRGIRDELGAILRAHPKALVAWGEHARQLMGALCRIVGLEVERP